MSKLGDLAYAIANLRLKQANGVAELQAAASKVVEAWEAFRDDGLLAEAERVGRREGIRQCADVMEQLVGLVRATTQDRKALVEAWDEGHAAGLRDEANKDATSNPYDSTDQGYAALAASQTDEDREAHAHLRARAAAQEMRHRLASPGGLFCHRCGEEHAVGQHIEPSEGGDA